MSHDRGCHCGKERYEYDDCTKPDCSHRSRPLVKPLPARHKCEASLPGPSTKCGKTAKYDVNGRKLCELHAGRMVLREMTK